MNEEEERNGLGYSDAELGEFRQLIEGRLEKARRMVTELQEQIVDLTESVSDEHGGDWIDDSSVNNEVEMLYDMMGRQRRYLHDLENALIRIRNRTYGVCTVTGALIDKRRLMAVPTTTKSLLAKTNPPRRSASSIEEEEASEWDDKTSVPKERKTTIRVRPQAQVGSLSMYRIDFDEDEDLIIQSLHKIPDFLEEEE